MKSTAESVDEDLDVYCHLRFSKGHTNVTRRSPRLTRQRKSTPSRNTRKRRQEDPEAEYLPSPSSPRKRKTAAGPDRAARRTPRASPYGSPSPRSRSYGSPPPSSLLGDPREGENGSPAPSSGRDYDNDAMDLGHDHEQPLATSSPTCTPPALPPPPPPPSSMSPPPAGSPNRTWIFNLDGLARVL